MAAPKASALDRSPTRYAYYCSPPEDFTSLSTRSDSVVSQPGADLPAYSWPRLVGRVGG